MIVRLVASRTVAEPHFELAGEYLELVCGPLLGPTAVLLARALDRGLEGSGHALVDLRDVALELGVRASSERPMGSSATLVRALERLERHEFVRRQDDDLLVVSTVHGPLARDELLRLPPGSRAAHERLVAAATAHASARSSDIRGDEMV